MDKETMEKIKEYINKEDLKGLSDYIDQKEKEIKNTEDKAGIYIDTLIQNLK